MAGPVVADLELEGVVEAALERLGQDAERERQLWHSGQRPRPGRWCMRMPPPGTWPGSHTDTTVRSDKQARGSPLANRE